MKYNKPLINFLKMRHMRKLLPRSFKSYEESFELVKILVAQLVDYLSFHFVGDLRDSIPRCKSAPPSPLSISLLQFFFPSNKIKNFELI